MSWLQRRDWVALGFATTTGVAIGYLLQSYWDAPKLPAVTDKAFVLVVRLQLQAGAVPTVLAKWRELAEYCKAREPDTLTYEAIVSEDDPNLLVIYERYTSPEALSITHNSSAQFKAFGKWLAESELVLDKHKETFWESGVGYASR